MKIDYSIVSSNETPLYKNFWELTKLFWNKHIGIKPILCLIDDQEKIENSDDCIIHYIKKIPNIDSGFQAQIARMYVTKYYSEQICLTSDIDMFPISKKYFLETTKPYSDDSIVIFSSDAYKNQSRYPICYNAAKGSFFYNLLDLNCSFNEYCERLLSFGFGWDTDELYFGNKIDTYHDQSKIIKLNRGWNYGIASNRIDRVFWNYDVRRLEKEQYIDCHSLRPIELYKNDINTLLNILNLK
jgi:hypothetical protein